VLRLASRGQGTGNSQVPSNSETPPEDAIRAQEDSNTNAGKKRRRGGTDSRARRNRARLLDFLARKDREREELLLQWLLGFQGLPVPGGETQQEVLQGEIDEGSSLEVQVTLPTTIPMETDDETDEIAVTASAREGGEGPEILSNPLPTLSCDDCGKTFSNAGARAGHRKWKHPDGGPERLREDPGPEQERASAESPDWYESMRQEEDDASPLVP